MELAQGCRDKVELARLKRGLAERNTETVPITPAIIERAAEPVDNLGLSHGIRRAYALIGATAIVSGDILITANVKHCGNAEGLDIEVFEP